MLRLRTEMSTAIENIMADTLAISVNMTSVKSNAREVYRLGADIYMMQETRVSEAAKKTCGVVAEQDGEYQEQ